LDEAFKLAESEIDT